MTENWIWAWIKVHFIMMRFVFCMNLGVHSNQWNNIVSIETLYKDSYPNIELLSVQSGHNIQTCIVFFHSKFQCSGLLGTSSVGKQKVSVKSGKTEGIWKWARWIDIRILWVEWFELSWGLFAGVFIPFMLTVRISCCYRLMWNALCLNGQSSVVSSYFCKQKAGP